MANCASTQAPGDGDAAVQLAPQWQACHSEQEYLSKVEACLEALREGNSYELCLTTTLYRKQAPCPRALYRLLRQVNPAPMAAFLDLGGSRPLTVSYHAVPVIAFVTLASTAAAAPSRRADIRYLAAEVAWAALSAALQACALGRQMCQGWADGPDCAQAVLASGSQHWYRAGPSR